MFVTNDQRSSGGIGLGSLGDCCLTEYCLGSGQTAATQFATEVCSVPSCSLTASSTTAAGTGSSLLNTLASAAGAVVGGAISGAALQATNAQRIAQGLPPLNANGTVMTLAQMQAAGYSSTQIAAVSSQLSGGNEMLLILGVLAVGAVLLMSK
jgi:hypothetical protein